ncbi:MAG: hypothetical protein J3Q66DRAFT_350441 [Benniella sp.]|nr:MAG: hypothetical protein J3Q66DRAFT_350441 [Benniella sp.]
MFGLPELDYVICLQLTRHDLAQCARVNRTWHTAIIPYLWGDLTKCTDSQQHAFAKLVREDYYNEHGRRELSQESHDPQGPTQAQSALPLSALAKYGPLIRALGDPDMFLQLSKGQEEESTKLQLLLHVLKRCYAAQLSFFHLKYDKLESDERIKEIGELVLPRVHNLSVQASFRGRRGELWKLKYLLCQCSTSLKRLTLEVDYSFADEVDTYRGYDKDFDKEEEGSEAIESSKWTSLKDLVLYPRSCVGELQPSTFWSWFFKRCGQVERLDVSKFRRGTASSIARNMLDHMPLLNEITLGHNPEEDFPISTMNEDRVAELLHGSHQGWKVVRLKGTARFGNDSLDALRRHFPTLQELRMDRHTSGLHGLDLLQVLSSCPNLHTVHGDTAGYAFSSEVLIDWDPNTDAPRTWACETSLKKFILRITDIPRPDLNVEIGVEPDQAQEIQSRVYDRLARFTNLETLWLGNKPYEPTRARMFRVERQQDCLELSLESGLGKLSGLRNVRELSVSDMATKIGVKEAKWMAEHWPRLQVVHGLDTLGPGKEAAEWLREHCPEIKLL